MWDNIDMHPFPTQQMVEQATPDMALHWLATLPKATTNEEKLIMLAIYERYIALEMGGDVDWRRKYTRLNRWRDLLLPVMALILALMVLLPPAPC